ncbi:PAS domain S-box protein [Mycobacterium alsense]|uniref:PAS domain S-box protein n=1 Tax=Mycobacterium alsense TaxID=324058 RepID=UPI000B0091B3|nr:PAS domain S-box protein [Mycobacterium alsense]
MSVAITKPQTAAPASPTPKAPSPRGKAPPSAGVQANCPGADAVVDRVRRVERRRNGQPGDTPMDVLARMPALVVLARLSIPSLAMSAKGVIVYANMAFAEMVGYELDQLGGSAFPEIFHALSAVRSAQAPADPVVQLQHCEGWTVRARMSSLATLRRTDPIVLLTFDDLTERLWADAH